ncbi:MAG: cell division protein [Ignavibacteria bacterium GWC2_35_8]|nr:MAG: cell division protein [Ignavibacteria bacterium GWC2_35_8]
MKKSAYIIILVSVSLCVLGLAFVMSASSTYSNIKFENLFHLFNSHIFRVALGLFFLIVFAIIPYDTYKHISKGLIFFITVVLIYTLFYAPPIKGSGRWINLGLMSFQPADLGKLFLIIHLAVLIERKGDSIQNLKVLILHLFFWVIIISGLIFFQPNISNGLILIFISLSMFFVGGAKLKHILATSLGSVLGAISIAMIFEHSRNRMLTFVKSILYGGGINDQVNQALLALGSGGLFGQGIGNSKQSNLFLPESYGDFIFAIIGEELGFIGSVSIIVGYFTIFIAGILVAKKARDTFGQLLAFGISFSIILNAFITIAVTTGIFPTTGVPLPFISYGGTSIIITCVSVGILVNIAILNAKYILPIQKINYGHAEEPV